MKSCHLVVAKALVALLISMGFGLVAEAQDYVTGSLEGLVVDSVTKAPIEGATVRIVNDVPKIDVVLRTDAKGSFSKALLPPGIFTVLVSASGYLPRQSDQRVYVLRPGLTLPIFLEPEKLPEKPQFSGGIAVASMPNAMVQLESLDGKSVLKRLIPPDQRLCVFDHLPSRAYRVSATLEGYQSAKREVIVAANETLPVTLDLSPNESSTQIAAQAGQFYALIIGNNDYRYLKSLHTAENDAREIEATLRRYFGFETRLLLNATREQILVALNEYRHKDEPNANLLIYYAGHGYNDNEVEKAYWLPVDSRKENNANWISADDITINVKGIRARHILIVADSCYSGTIVRGVEVLLTRPVDASGRDRYLLKMQNGRSRTLMASGGNEPVADDGGGNHSVFANALLTGLSQMDREIFSAEELYYNFVRQVVSGKSNQTPQYDPLRNSGHETGDFLFIRKRK